MVHSSWINCLDSQLFCIKIFAPNFFIFLHQFFIDKKFILIFIHQQKKFLHQSLNLVIFTPKIWLFLHQKFGYFYTKNLVIFTPKIWLFLHQILNKIFEKNGSIFVDKTNILSIFSQSLIISIVVLSTLVVFLITYFEI